MRRTRKRPAPGSNAYADLLASLTDQLAAWERDPDWNDDTAARYREGIHLLARLLGIDDDDAAQIVAARLLQVAQ